MWSEGETIVRREVLNDGSCWVEVPVVVVRDEPELLATYLPEGAPFTFPPHPVVHPSRRQGRSSWSGHGTLMLQRPGESYAIWHFWAGPERRFAGWYVNFQEPFRRGIDGYDTQDLELDIVVPVDGPWEWKDEEHFERALADGWLSPGQGEAVRTAAAVLAADLDAGRRWWDPAWAEWSPRVA